MYRYFTLLVWILFFSCGPKQQVPVSFYYWKTTLDIDDSSKAVLSNTNSTTLYLRYFDVGIVDNEIVPIAPILNVTSENVIVDTIIPVVYIKNEIMLMSDLNVDDLVTKIAAYIGRINNQHRKYIAELQFDCDWSEHSKQNYFLFLEKIKNKFDLPISATIRLHQVKFPTKSGIPPVDRGVLMYYNMNPIKYSGVNSIYDASTAKQYVKYLKSYSLPLDIALPIFSWAILERNERVVQLIRKVDWEDLRQIPEIKPIDATTYEVQESVVYAYQFLQKGDRLRSEYVLQEDITQMKKDIGKDLKGMPNKIIYYDLDGLNFKNMDYDYKSIKKMGDWY